MPDLAIESRTFWVESTMLLSVKKHATSQKLPGLTLQASVLGWLPTEVHAAEAHRLAGRARGAANIVPKVRGDVHHAGAASKGLVVRTID